MKKKLNKYDFLAINRGMNQNFNAGQSMGNQRLELTGLQHDPRNTPEHQHRKRRKQDLLADGKLQNMDVETRTAYRSNRIGMQSKSCIFVRGGQV